MSLKKISSLRKLNDKVMPVLDILPKLQNTCKKQRQIPSKNAGTCTQRKRNSRREEGKAFFLETPLTAFVTKGRTEEDKAIPSTTKRGLLIAVFASVLYYNFRRTQQILDKAQENQHRLENGIMTLYNALAEQSQKMGELTEVIEKQHDLFVPKVEI